MSNITMCTQHNCKLRETCLRYTPNSNQFSRECYLNYDPRQEEEYCPYFYPHNQLNLF